MYFFIYICTDNMTYTFLKPRSGSISYLFCAFLIILIISSFNQLSAQTYNSTNGARAAGMAGAVINLQDVWATQNNIAAAAKIEETQISTYFQNRFGLGGLNYAAIASVKPLKHGVLGFSADRSGNQNLNEQRIGLGYAHNIDNVSLGAKVNILQVAIKDLGSRSVVAFEFGGVARLNKELVFGAHIYNFNKAKSSDFLDERFSTVMKAGLSYQPFEKLIIIFESEKNIEYDVDIKMGLEYEVLPKILFRSGFSTLTKAGAIGLGFKSKRFVFDYALNSHAQLGISNHISLGFILSGNTTSNKQNR